MHEPSAPRQPVFGDVPRVVITLAAAIVAVSAVIELGPMSVADPLISACAVWLGAEAAPYPQPLGPLAPYALHVFAHGGWLHLALNMAALLAFGSASARRLRSPLRFLAFFFACSIAGALVETLLPPRDTVMLGASSGVFGLIAGATYAHWARGGPLPSLGSRPMLVGLAPWVGINILFALIGGGVFGLPGIAWAAHLGGLAAGAVLFPFLDPSQDGPRAA